MRGRWWDTVAQAQRSVHGALDGAHMLAPEQGRGAGRAHCRQQQSSPSEQGGVARGTVDGGHGRRHRHRPSGHGCRGEHVIYCRALKRVVFNTAAAVRADSLDQFGTRLGANPGRCIQAACHEVAIRIDDGHQPARGHPALSNQGLEMRTGKSMGQHVAAPVGQGHRIMHGRDELS